MDSNDKIIQQKRRFFPFIHILRGIAPLMVVWAHLVWWLIYNQIDWPLYQWMYWTIIKPLHIFQNFGHLGVAIFFLISGFIISASLSREKRLEFLIKRLCRLGPALIFATLVVYLIHRGGGHHVLSCQIRNCHFYPILPVFFLSMFLFIIVLIFLPSGGRSHQKYYFIPQLFCF